jgi:hypothetical protein
MKPYQKLMAFYVEKHTGVDHIDTLYSQDIVKQRLIQLEQHMKFQLRIKVLIQQAVQKF